MTRSNDGPADEARPAGGQAPTASAEARSYFGPRLDMAVAYADLLAGPGTERGLIGPREVDRLWERHLLNCAVLAELIPAEATVCDVGSGAGLPGVVLAIARPDLRVILMEPLLRRSIFLQECVTTLGLRRASVIRGRGEEYAGRLAVDIVTARAVAPLGRLAGWTLPLLRPRGELLAMKGTSAAEELAVAGAELDRLGAGERSVVTVGSGVVQPPTTVVRIRAGDVGRIAPGSGSATPRNAGRKAGRGRRDAR